MLPEENEAQVTAFLARHPDFILAGDFLSLSPARHGTDGFFAGILHRSESSPDDFGVEYIRSARDDVAWTKHR